MLACDLHTQLPYLHRMAFSRMCVSRFVMATSHKGHAYRHEQVHTQTHSHFLTRSHVDTHMWWAYAMHLEGTHLPALALAEALLLLVDLRARREHGQARPLGRVGVGRSI